MPAPTVDPKKLMDSPAIRAWRKSKIYERTATVDEIDLDLATIKAIRDRGKARAPLYLLSLLGSLAGGVLLASALRDPPASPAALVAGVVGAIVAGVLWAYEPSAENRRVELLRGFMHRLNLEPGSQLKVKLDLAPIDAGYKKKIDRNEQGWSVEYHHDDWLLVEGRLQAGTGVAFRYTRADSRRQAVHVSVSGNVRTTRTRIQGWFHDAVALRFAPDGFPGAAQLGPEAYQKLKLPEGFETKHFLGQAGQLELTVTSDRKWDAGPPGARLDGGDAVMIAGLWLGILFDLLGAVSEPFHREPPPPPPPTVKVPFVDGEGVLSTITHPAFAIGVFAVPALLSFWAAVGSFERAARSGEDADRYEREAKSQKDARARIAKKKEARYYRNREDDKTTEGIVEIVGGVVLLGAGGAAAGLGAMRRKKKAAEDAARAQQPPGAPPQQGYPQQPYSQQQGYPQQGYPQQGYPGAPPGWPPQSGGGHVV